MSNGPETMHSKVVHTWFTTRGHLTQCHLGYKLLQRQNGLHRTMSEICTRVCVKGSPTWAMSGLNFGESAKLRGERRLSACSTSLTKLSRYSVPGG